MAIRAIMIQSKRGNGAPLQVFYFRHLHTLLSRNSDRSAYGGSVIRWSAAGVERQDCCRGYTNYFGGKHVLIRASAIHQGLRACLGDSDS